MYYLSLPPPGVSDLGAATGEWRAHPEVPAASVSPGYPEDRERRGKTAQINSSHYTGICGVCVWGGGGSVKTILCCSGFVVCLRCRRFVMLLFVGYKVLTAAEHYSY